MSNVPWNKTSGMEYLGHYTIKDMYDFGLGDLSAYYKWCFVRNPWDRLVSVYDFSIHYQQMFPTFELFIDTIYKYKEAYTKKNVKWTRHVDGGVPNLIPHIPEVFMFSQTSLITLDDKICMDFVGRFENLKEDWNKVCEVMKEKFPVYFKNNPVCELPEMNSRQELKHSVKFKQPYQLSYTEETMKKVGEIYKDDIVNFNYKFENVQVAPVILKSSPSDTFNKLSSHKISMMQLDPFSFCNAGCWFCPVKYKPNPVEAKKHMPVELLEKIISNLNEERIKPDGLVDKNFHFVYTAHYNEVLLYKYFKEMVQIFKRYGIKTYVLTNGLPLTPEKTDIIADNLDTVVGICMNVPAFEKETWSKRSGMDGRQFDRLVSNIKYAENKLVALTKDNRKQLSIQINGADDRSFYEQGGYLEKGKNFPSDMDLNPSTGELARQVELCRQMFPSINIYPVNSLIDRAGILGELGVISNKRAIDNKIKRSPDDVVVGCGNGIEVGGRPVGWLHVNALGDAFLCCNDYDFDYKFGSFATQTLRDFWLTEARAAIIDKSYKEICVNCASAKWGPKT